MKRIAIVGSIFLFFSGAWANQTRMNTLIAGDYIDDPVNISVFPQHIMIFQNYFYGDIFNNSHDYGMVFAPKSEYGGLAIWNSDQFCAGYGITLKRFDLGLYGSPIEDHTRLGIGIGRAYFDSRIDVSFIMNNGDSLDVENFHINVRLLKRKMDFVIIPRYTFSHNVEPASYTQHRAGLMLQKLILNEGFVFLAGEYLNSKGDVDSSCASFLGGIELPLSRVVTLRMGCKEVLNLDQGVTTADLLLEPGVGFRIREFNLDFHVNQGRLFNKDLTFVESFGLDLNFGKF